MSGYAEKGFIYEIKAKRQYPNLYKFWNVLIPLLQQDLEQYGFNERKVTRLIPFFRLSNYDNNEPRYPGIKDAMRKLHPDPGGQLRRSINIQIQAVSDMAIRVKIRWETPYLGYLIAHGKSREKWTSLDFAAKIYKMGYFRIRIFAFMKKAGRIAGFPNHKKLSILNKGAF